MKFKKILKTICIVVVVLIFGVANWGIPWLENQIGTQLLRALPEGSTIGKVSYSPFRNSVTIENLTIPNPPGYSEKRKAVVVKRLYADLNVLALFRRVIYLESLKIGPVDIQFEFKKLPENFEELISAEWIKSGCNLSDLVQIMTNRTPSEQVAEKPEPVTEKPEQVAEKPEQVTEKPEPVAEKPEQVAEKPEPVAEKPEPVAEKQEPVAEKPEQVAKKPEQVAEKPEPVAENPEQVAEKQEPVTEKPEQVAEKQEPVAENPEQVAEKPEQVAEKPEQVVEKPEEKTGESWKLRIDRLQIDSVRVYFPNLKVPQPQDMKDAVIKMVLSVLPPQWLEGERSRQVVVFASSWALKFVEKNNKELLSLKQGIKIPLYVQENLGQDEKTSCRGVVLEIAERHWTHTMNYGEYRLNVYLKKAKTKLEELKKKVQEYTEKVKKGIEKTQEYTEVGKEVIEEAQEFIDKNPEVKEKVDKIKDWWKKRSSKR